MNIPEGQEGSAEGSVKEVSIGRGLFFFLKTLEIFEETLPIFDQPVNPSNNYSNSRLYEQWKRRIF